MGVGFTNVKADSIDISIPITQSYTGDEILTPVTYIVEPEGRELELVGNSSDHLEFSISEAEEYNYTVHSSLTNKTWNVYINVYTGSNGLESIAVITDETGKKNDIISYTYKSTLFTDDNIINNNKNKTSQDNVQTGDSSLVAGYCIMTLLFLTIVIILLRKIKTNIRLRSGIFIWCWLMVL